MYIQMLGYILENSTLGFVNMWFIFVIVYLLFIFLLFVQKVDINFVTEISVLANT